MRKKLFLAALPFILLTFLISGCDSPTDTKAVSVTAPSLSTPADNSEHVPVTPTFTWTGEATKIEVASNTTFANLIYSSDVTGTQHTLAGQLQSGTEYFWRAGRLSGGTMYWSSTTFRFRTN